MPDAEKCFKYTILTKQPATAEDLAEIREWSRFPSCALPPGEGPILPY